MIRKPILFACLSLAIVAFLWACSCGSGGPKASARRFLVALKTHDFDKAKCMVSQESYSALSMQIDQLAQNTPGKASDIEIISVDKGDTRAKVTYSDMGEKKSIEVIKVCGEWRPVFQKEPILPDSLKYLFDELTPPPPTDEDSEEEDDSDN